MSKKYGLSGLNSLVELGKGGVQVRSNAGQLEARNNANDALVKLKALDGTASDDVVTKNQLDNVTVSGVVNYRTAEVSYTDSGAVNIGATVTGNLAFRWQVVVTTAFNAGSPTLDLGTSGDTDAITANANIDLTTVGVYSGVSSLDISTSTQIIGTVVNGSSTAGICDVIIEWI